jgi:hypothetical protein
MRFNFARHTLVSMLVSLVFCVAVCYASTDATVTGLITDHSGAVVPGATVVFTNINTNVPYTTQTNGVGVYSLSTLSPGVYRANISKDGFKSIVKGDIELHVQDQLSINFELQVGSVSESITVSGGAPVVNTESAAVSTVVDRQFVENIPLNGRSFQSLIETVPGVTAAPGAGVGSKGEFSVNGQRTEENYYTVDGVAANTGVSPSAGGASSGGQFPGETALGTMQSLASIDDLEEFRINTSTYSAEFGHTPGAQIAIQTRSGTDAWHGSAFEYFRNDVLDANNWFNNASAIRKTPERTNDFGGSLGGPVVIPGLYNGKDKTFFFFSYEGMRLRVPQAATTFWVPDMTLRQTAAAAIQPILNALPVPNGAEQTSDFALFTGAYSAPATLNSTSIRVDQILGQKWRIFGRFSDTPSSSTTRSSTQLSDLHQTSFNMKTFTVGATTMLSSRFSNDLRFNATWNSSALVYSLDNFGGATPVQPQQLSSVPLLGGYQFALSFMIGTMPTVQALSFRSPQRQLNVVDTFSAVLGSHILKYGFDYRRLATDQIANQLMTTFIYSTLPQILNDSAQLARAQQWGATPPEFIFSNYSAFVQDDWKATNRLHLSLGLRWDINPPPVNGNGPQAYTLNQITNLATAQLAPQGTPLWNTDYHGFAPRVGFAYALRQSPAHPTVFRGGFGLFYDTGTNWAGYGIGGGIGFKVVNSYTNVAFPLTAQQLTFAAPSVASPYQALVVAVDPNLVLPRVYEWNTSLEQGLGVNQALTVSYVGSSGHDLLATRFYNPATINPNFSLGNALYVTTNAAASNYNALQVQFQRHLSHGLQALASYTWAHSIDDLSGNVDNTTPLIRGNSDFDIRHTFSAALTYNVPDQYANRIAQAALAHWSLDGRIMARSALPVMVTSGVFFASGIQEAAVIPNVNAGVPVYLYGSQYPGGRAVNLAAFSAPPAGQQGYEPRNFVRGLNLWQTDLAIRREFPLHERLKLQFRAEAFNLFNRPNFGAIDNSTTDGPALFGKATGTLNSQLGGLNPLFQEGGPRSFQLALKLMF